MANSYLRIIVSNLSEIPFVKMSILEADGIIDRILIVEHNFTHTGIPKPYYFGEVIQNLESLSKKTLIEYIQVDLEESIIKLPEGSIELHHNEYLMRKSFSELIDIRPSDTVFCPDADEVIFRSTIRIVASVLKIFTWCPMSIRLPMNQFFYKPNYLWIDAKFSSTIVGHYSKISSNEIRFRDHGLRLPFKSGCHFSWHLTIPQMMEKLDQYAHSEDYASVKNRELLTKAVQDKTYPFDTRRKFTIRELSARQTKKVHPKSFSLISGELSHLWKEN